MDARAAAPLLKKNHGARITCEKAEDGVALAGTGTAGPHRCFSVLAGACQRHGVGGFLLCNTNNTCLFLFVFFFLKHEHHTEKRILSGGAGPLAGWLITSIAIVPNPVPCKEWPAGSLGAGGA